MPPVPMHESMVKLNQMINTAIEAVYDTNATIDELKANNADDTIIQTHLKTLQNNNERLRQLMRAKQKAYETL